MWNVQELFKYLTKTVTKILKTQSVYVYVDGIDHSGEAVAKLVQDPSKLLETSQPNPSTKKPNVTHGLKVIFSSTIVPAKEPFPQSYINVDEKNRPSLKQFLEEQLSTADYISQISFCQTPQPQHRQLQPKQKSPYMPYPGASQQDPGEDSLKPFQSFQPNTSPGSPLNTILQPRSLPGDRYSLSSHSSYIHRQTSADQVTQQETAQGYQPFSVNPQKPSMLPSQPQAPEIKPFDSSVKLVSLPSIERKPIGAQSGQPEQPVTAAPVKSSPPNHLQASQSPVGIAQTTHE
ncbi:hypothetical protein FPOAC2_04529 [Fusarium poae]